MEFVKEGWNEKTGRNKVQESLAECDDGDFRQRYVGPGISTDVMALRQQCNLNLPCYHSTTESAATLWRICNDFKQPHPGFSVAIGSSKVTSKLGERHEIGRASPDKAIAIAFHFTREALGASRIR